MTVEQLRRMDAVSADEHESSMGVLACDRGNLPLSRLAYRSELKGCVVRSIIEQTFVNSTDELLEATYLFPIEGEQAVTACSIQVQERCIRADLQERSAARRTYRRAIQNGHRAALLEEQRSETFTMQVGNIPPGESIRVTIETVGPLSVVDGEWTLRIPLVVAPRYTSGIPSGRKPVGGGTVFDTDQVPDASCITPAVLLPGFPDPIDLALSVTIEGDDLKSARTWSESLECSLHTINLVETAEAPGCSLHVLSGERVDRDFILRGRFPKEIPSLSATIESVRLPDCRVSSDSNSEREETPECTAFSLSVVAPTSRDLIPKEVVFLLDQSGSMDGWKFEASKRATTRLIESLSNGDRFTLAAFSDGLNAYHSSGRRRTGNWITATDENRFAATQWLARQDISGGTELGSALLWAVNAFKNRSKSDGADTVSASRSIVLITDGQITGEDAVMAALGTLDEELRPRVYCIGVDRAVNASVLRRLSNASGGSFELVESERRLTEVLTRFSRELGRPTLTNVAVTVDSDSDEWTVAMRSCDSIHAGRLWQVFGTCTGRRGATVTLRAQQASGDVWERKVTLNRCERALEKNTSLNLPMWGRFRVRHLEDEMAIRNTSDTRSREQIVATSLFANTLSKYTAYVAVDSERASQTKLNLLRVFQPNALPEGWQLNAVVGLSAEDLARVRPLKTLNATALEEHAIADLIAKNHVSAEQVEEAKQVALNRGMCVFDALRMLEYTDGSTIARSKSDVLQLPYISLAGVEIPEEVLQQIPESVARENNCIAIGERGDELIVATADPLDIETIEKLTFILNRRILTVVECREVIEESISKHYGAVHGESVDSLLQEFTDTQIDFTETVDFADTVDSSDTVDDLEIALSYDSPSAASPPRAGQSDYDVAGFIDPARLRISPPCDSRYRHNANPSQNPGGQTDAVLQRLVMLLLSEIVQLKAEMAFIERNSEGIRISLMINGTVIERDKLLNRLWQDLVSAIASLAGCTDFGERGNFYGRIKIMVADRESILDVYHSESIPNKIFVIAGLTDPLPEVIQA